MYSSDSKRNRMYAVKQVKSTSTCTTTTTIEYTASRYPTLTSHGLAYPHSMHISSSVPPFLRSSLRSSVPLGHVGVTAILNTNTNTKYKLLPYNSAPCSKVCILRRTGCISGLKPKRRNVRAYPPKPRSGDYDRRPWLGAAWNRVCGWESGSSTRDSEGLKYGCQSEV